MAEMAQLRYPRPLAPTANISPTLRTLDPESGWLVTRDSHLTGLADIHAYDQYPGNPLAAGWLPSRRQAFIYRAFASHDKGSPTAVPTPTRPSILRGTLLTYSIDPYDTAWIRIEYFDGDTLIHNAVPGDDSPFSISMTTNTAGYAVLHALLTYPDGSRRTTMPRRKFIESAHRDDPAPHPEIFGEFDLDVGAPLNLTAFMIGIQATPAPELRWMRNGILLSGQNTSSLSIAAVGPDDAGIYQLSADQDTSSWLSEPLHVFVSPVTHPVIGSIAGPASVDAGTRTTLTSNVPTGQSGLQLQWHRNGNPIAGATSATLDIPLTQSWHAGTYTLTGRIRSAQSISAAKELHINTPAINPGRLMNLSVRGLSRGDEQVMIAGYVIEGGEKSILSRAVGAGLARFGVPGTLADPTMRLLRTPVSNQAIWVADNDNWNEHPEAATLRNTAAEVGVFALGETDPDATLLERLCLPDHTPLWERELIRAPASFYLRSTILIRAPDAFSIFPIAATFQARARHW